MKKEKNILRRKKGITLIALVITIVVLIIISSISLYFIFQKDGVISKAQLAKQKQEEATINEQAALSEVNNKIEDYISNARGDNSNISIGEFEPQVTNITTLSIVVNSNLNIPDKDFVYIYILNNEIKNYSKDKQVEISDLSENTEYKIIVVAVDNTGYVSKSKEITIKTKPATYLYNNGAISPLASDFIVAGYVGPGSKSFNKYDNYMRLSVNQTSTAYSIRGTNQIDFSKYSAIYFDVNISRSVSNTESHFFLSTASNYNSVDNYTGNIGVYKNSSTSGKQYIKLDVSSINTSAYIYIRQTHTGYIDINKIWLEE